MVHMVNTGGPPAPPGGPTQDQVIQAILNQPPVANVLPPNPAPNPAPIPTPHK